MPQKVVNLATLTGQVLDKKTLSSLSHASISTSQIATSTNNNGYFMINNLPAGDVNLTIQASGFTPYDSIIRLIEGQPLTAKAGELVPAQPQLRPGETIGTLTDALREILIAPTTSAWRL